MSSQSGVEMSQYWCTTDVHGTRTGIKRLRGKRSNAQTTTTTFIFADYSRFSRHQFKVSKCIEAWVGMINKCGVPTTIIDCCVGARDTAKPSLTARRQCETDSTMLGLAPSSMQLFASSPDTHTWPYWHTARVLGIAVIYARIRSTECFTWIYDTTLEHPSQHPTRPTLVMVINIPRP